MADSVVPVFVHRKEFKGSNSPVCEGCGITYVSKPTSLLQPEEDMWYWTGRSRRYIFIEGIPSIHAGWCANCYKTKLQRNYKGDTFIELLGNPSEKELFELRDKHYYQCSKL